MLKSQLLIPRIDHTVPRERLYPIFNEMGRQPVTTVVAGAGYGKTTFVAQALAYLDLPAVWYQADSWDTAFTSLFRHISLAIRDRYPDFAAIAPQFRGAVDATVRKQKSVLMAWLNALEGCIKDRLLIVIDDFHHFDNVDPVTAGISFVLARLPEKIGWIFLSRTDPRLQLSTVRTRRQLVEIKEADLAFTLEETRRLFNAAPCDNLEQEVLQRINHKSGGWVSGLILLQHLLKNRTPQQLAAYLDGATGSILSMADYLEENVYAGLSPEIKNFLVKTSLLPHLERRLCNQILSIDNAADILSYLTKHHLFTYALDEVDEHFYLHQLFREFLQGRLEKTFTREEINALHIDIAENLVVEGRAMEAVRHYILAGEDQKSRELIEENGFFWILQGKLSQVAGLINRLPDHLVRQQPRLMHLKGLLFFLSGRLNDAQSAFQTALDRFRASGDTLGVATCLKDMAFHHYYMGDVRKAVSQLEQVASVGASPMLAMEANGLLVFLSSVLGRLEAGDQYHKAALRQLHRLPSEHHVMGRAYIRLNESYRYCVSGDFSRSMACIEKGLDAVKSCGLDVLLPLTYFQLAYTSYFLRRFETGCAYAASGLAATKSVGVHDNQVAWLHLSMALNLMGMDETRKALDHALESLVVFQEMGNPWGQAMAHEALFSVKFRSTSLGQEAESHLLAGLTALKGLGYDTTEALLQLDLAECLMETGDRKTLESLLMDAREKGAPSKFQTAMALLQNARYHYLGHDMATAVEKLVAGLELAVDHGYEGWALCEKEWLRPLLTAFFNSDMPHKKISDLLSGCGAEGEALLAECRLSSRSLKRTSAENPLQALPLHVQLLGAFTLFQGNQQIPLDQWKSKKAKTLFKYLVSQRNRGYIHRDELMELLWPDQPPEKTANRFHVALNALRRTLEPGLTRGTPSAYLLKEENAYRISLGNGGSTDVSAFMTALETAKAHSSMPESTLSLLTKAESLYRGPFLTEDRFAEWAQAKRHELERIHLDLISRIVDTCIEQRKWRQCIEYASRYIEVDGYAEHMYRGLMKCHAALGENLGVERVYRRCRSAIVEDLGSDLSLETEALYRKLV